MIFSIINMKGGSGKSTVATNLAVMFASDGQEVLLVDADPGQNTALNWLADRPADLPKIHGASLPANNLFREADFLRKKYQTVVVDGGARVTEHNHAAVASADYLIIPVRPSKADLDATALFVDAAKADMIRRPGLKAAVLMCQLQENTGVAATTRTQLDGWDFAVFESVICSRVAYIESLWCGQGVIEYAPKSAAADEMRRFYNELKGDL